MKSFKLLLVFSVSLLTGFSLLYFLNSENGKANVSEKNIEIKDVLPVTTNQSSLTSDELKTIELYEKASPAVVYITSYKTEYVSYFFDVYPQTSEGQGSGVIIDSKNGYIVTNYHVVGNADRLTVTLNQEEADWEATIVGVDPENDLAVIKIKDPPATLTAIKMGTSENLRIGQSVYAIGNPFGFDHTLTSGIISALNRNIKSSNGVLMEGTIQTDASINPGNSGGPLLDSSGNLIGINTMIVSPSSGSVGIGFAIPVDKVKDVVPQLVEFGYVKRGWIDATFLPVNRRLSRALNLGTDTGLMVMQVAQNGEAYKGGLRGGNQKAMYGNRVVMIGGEVITAINDVKITDYNSLVNVLKNSKVGEIVKVTYMYKRRNYETNVKLIDKRLFTDR
ncbi:MAG: trypsin-like peptidase domain-containing protein [Spirochaetales bacterium]|nr:trypsin-like peptidase domain-containing protein [Spirochaetales bacterium]MBQ2125097.1 trypsin-like peptidase domain-containing protein [Spirochaetales bacterium]